MTNAQIFLFRVFHNFVKTFLILLVSYRLASHCIYAAESTSKPVCIVAEDTDVYILLLHFSSLTKEKIYFRQGTKSSKAGITYHNVTVLAETLGLDICNILPAFHALTGSDYTNPFFRRSKIRSFKKLLKLPDKCALLTSMLSGKADVDQVTDFVLHIIYNRPLREKTPGDSRYAMLFVKNGKQTKFAPTKSLPPDYDSLHQKIKRANFVAYGWKNSLYGEFDQPDPLLYGWKYENEVLMPVWYEGKALPDNDEILGYVDDKQDEFELPSLRSQKSNDSDSESDSDGDVVSSEDEIDY